MIGYYKQITQHLKNAGFYFLRDGKGSHELWSKGSVTVTVPYNCKSKHTGNAILKQAGIAFKL
ncbi:MAG: type II toxin-antitoxin system HicA family toxin [Candidatus Methylopumilus sp.]|nr:type II toxin-antitoxin system HicA family toxin [Candidatus Methylopumilus sp.]